MIQSSLSFFSALIIGLLGTTHCLAMCGGIASSFSLSDRKPRGALGRLLAYNLGRITSYTLAGFLLGLVGASIYQTGAAIPLRSVAGLLLIAMGLYVGQWWMGITQLESAGAYLWRFISPLLKPLLPADNAIKALMLGIGWGWLPCGLVYSTLIWSAAAGSATDSALLMLGFGLGTLPGMLATGLLAKQLQAFSRATGVRGLAGLLLILMGLWTLPWHGIVSQFTSH